MKEVISLTMVAGQAAENHGDEWLDLKFTKGDTYINSNLNPLTKVPSNSRSTKDICPCNISQNISYGASCFGFDRKSMGTETTTRSEFSNGGKAIEEHTPASKEIN